jgi:hypothetical protein
VLGLRDKASSTASAKWCRRPAACRWPERQSRAVPHSEAQRCASQQWVLTVAHWRRPHPTHPIRAADTAPEPSSCHEVLLTQQSRPSLHQMPHACSTVVPASTTTAAGQTTSHRVRHVAWGTDTGHAAITSHTITHPPSHYKPPHDILNQWRHISKTAPLTPRVY